MASLTALHFVPCLTTNPLTALHFVPCLTTNLLMALCFVSCLTTNLCCPYTLAQRNLLIKSQIAISSKHHQMHNDVVHQSHDVPHFFSQCEPLFPIYGLSSHLHRVSCAVKMYRWLLSFRNDGQFSKAIHGWRCGELCGGYNGAA